MTYNDEMELNEAAEEMLRSNGWMQGSRKENKMEPEMKTLLLQSS